MGYSRRSPVVRNVPGMLPGLRFPWALRGGYPGTHGIASLALLAAVFVSLPGAASAQCTCNIQAADPTGEFPQTHFLAERVYDMKAIIEDCTNGTHCMTDAVHAVRDHVPVDAAVSYVAKTLYFAPGGDYLITTPIVLDDTASAPRSVVFRGEAGSWHPGSSPDDWGTTFECAVASGNACITVRKGTASTPDTYHGFRFEGITMRWSDAAGVTRPNPSAGEYVVGLSLWRNRGSTIRDSRWIDFPGTSILLQDNCNPVYLERLALVSDEPDSLFGIFLAGTQVSGALPDAIVPFVTGLQTVANNSPALSGLYVEGYGTALHVLGSVEGKLTDSRFVDQNAGSVVLDRVFGWKIRGCHFELGTTMNADSAIILDYTSGNIARSMADISVSDCYFDLGCATDRSAVWARAAHVDTAGMYVCRDQLYWRARVFVTGCTVTNSAAKPLRTSDPFNYWQCQANRMVTRTSSGGVTTQFFGADECQPDPQDCTECGGYACHDEMPLIPVPPSACITL